jgi:hypothetical protein
MIVDVLGARRPPAGLGDRHIGRSRTTFRKGHKGRGGRPKGALNRTTLEVRALARGLIEDPAYLAALRRRLLAGKAGQIEALLFGYAFGRPIERPAVPAEASRHVPLNGSGLSSPPELDLSKEGREKLLGLVEAVRAYLNESASIVPPREAEP